MKKLLLATAFCISAYAVSAQRADNVKLPATGLMGTTSAQPIKKNVSTGIHSKMDNVDTWYSYPFALNKVYLGGGIQAYAPYMFLDTTVMYVYLDATQTYVSDTVRYCSLGACLDPKDQIFDEDVDDPAVTFSEYTSYTLDSLAIPYFYYRPVDTMADGTPVKDKLYIQLFKGVEPWTIGQDPNNPDQRFGTVLYDIKTGFAKSPTTTITKTLTMDDTATAGYGVMGINVDNFTVPAGTEIAAVVTYIPGQAFTKGDTLASADTSAPAVTNPVNGFRMRILVDNSAFPLLTYNNGLLINYQQRHLPTFLMNSTSGARYIPSMGWGAPQYPDIQFKISATNVGIEENLGSLNAEPRIYPNPASDAATLILSLNKAENVSVNIQNIVGQTIRNVSNGSLNAGDHKISFNTSDLQPGVYFCNVQAGGASTTHKFIISR